MLIFDIFEPWLLYYNSFDKFNKTWALMLDPLYNDKDYGTVLIAPFKRPSWRIQGLDLHLHPCEQL